MGMICMMTTKLVCATFLHVFLVRRHGVEHANNNAPRLDAIFASKPRDACLKGKRDRIKTVTRKLESLRKPSPKDQPAAQQKHTECLGQTVLSNRLGNTASTPVPQPCL